jgi:glutathione synthase/RimK-type ligase-like ATP-grasp enzyme
MPNVLILVDQPEEIAAAAGSTGRTIVDVRDYIAGQLPAGRRATKIINLSRDYGYLGYGYYASLLAAARGHKVVPSAETLVDMAQRGRRWSAIEALDKVLERTIARLKEPPEAPFVLTVFFGRPDDSRYARLAAQAFDRFRCPILRLSIKWDDRFANLPGGGWYVQSVKPLALRDLREDLRTEFWAALDTYTRVDWRAPRMAKSPRWTLAILHDPKEEFGPSDSGALRKFQRIGGDLGLAVELITRRDYARLAEFDALFIRETTAIDHHTFRFAKKAQDEGMPVIDDPLSIIRCTNKIYLAELLQANGIPTPRTVITGRRRLNRVEDSLTYPMVLKIPDGSFSRGVVKVNDRADLTAKAKVLFEDSDLILAQAFTPTDFDWRVGVLAGEPLFVSQYKMARNHWQIYKHAEDGGKAQSGGFRTVHVEDAPEEVVEVAVRAARLMGDGLYGVDVKQNASGVFVIEINDNPNIDSGVEDLKLKDDLYRRVLKEFVRRLENR